MAEAIDSGPVDPADIDQEEIDHEHPDVTGGWLRPAVFVTGLRTDLERAATRKDYASVGSQVDLRFSVLHWYEMILSAGYAVGIESGRKAGHEWMISLKIM